MPRRPPRETAGRAATPSNLPELLNRGDADRPLSGGELLFRGAGNSNLPPMSAS